MYSNYYVLDSVQEMYTHVLRQNIGLNNFEYNHTQLHDGYRTMLEIRPIIDPNNGNIIPMITFNHKIGDERPSLFRMAGKTFFSVNSSTEESRTFDLNDLEIDTLLKSHGYTEHEIEMIKSIRFSMQMFISKQQ